MTRRVSFALVLVTSMLSFACDQAAQVRGETSGIVKVAVSAAWLLGSTITPADTRSLSRRLYAAAPDSVGMDCERACSSSA